MIDLDALLAMANWGDSVSTPKQSKALVDIEQTCNTKGNVVLLKYAAVRFVQMRKQIIKTATEFELLVRMLSRSATQLMDELGDDFTDVINPPPGEIIKNRAISGKNSQKIDIN